MSSINVVTDERARLLTEMETERDRRVEWKLAVRRYAARIFHDRYTGTPCAEGVARWLSYHCVPRMSRSDVNGYNGLVVGNEEAARLEARSSTVWLTPEEIAQLNDIQLEQHLLTLRKRGEDWRDNLIAQLHIAASDWSGIPPVAVEELIAVLNGAEEAAAAAAPFPDATAPVVEAVAVQERPAQPEPFVTLQVLIAMPLRMQLTARQDELLQDETIRVTIRSQLGDALRRSVRSSLGLQLEDEITFSIGITR